MRASGRVFWGLTAVLETAVSFPYPRCFEIKQELSVDLDYLGHCGYRIPVLERKPFNCADIEVFCFFVR